MRVIVGKTCRGAWQAPVTIVFATSGGTAAHSRTNLAIVAICAKSALATVVVCVGCCGHRGDCMMGRAGACQAPLRGGDAFCRGGGVSCVGRGLSLQCGASGDNGIVGKENATIGRTNHSRN